MLRVALINKGNFVPLTPVNLLKSLEFLEHMGKYCIDPTVLCRSCAFLRRQSEDALCRIEPSKLPFALRRVPMGGCALTATTCPAWCYPAWILMAFWRMCPK